MIDILYLILLISLFFLSLVYAIYLILGWFKYTPFYPSSSQDFIEVLKNQKIDISKMNVVDIGSGDGRITHAAGKIGAKSAVGIEVNPFLTLYSKVRKNLQRLDNVEFLSKDARNVSYNDFDLVYIYLFPEFIESIEDKLKKELKPGTIIISKVFGLKKFKKKAEYKKFKIYEVSK